jgi:hypothetical protein
LIFPVRDIETGRAATTKRSGMVIVRLRREIQRFRVDVR